MMRKLFFTAVVLLLAAPVFAQAPRKVIPPPLSLRQVSGIVLDSTESPLRGALVTLTSKTDTLKTSSTEEGLFFFTDVKSAVFSLAVTSLGYRNYVKLGKYNDATARLTMDPIIMRTRPEVMLKEVTINGRPSIIYKTDTVEYKASDYIVRAGSGVDELLKKMEGMDVAKDGSLTYNGAPVEKAKLNGKDILGGKGNVATVTRLLPADIVEKVQVVDDYGEQAARSGIKDGIPDKVVNITTKADKSIGYIARLSGGAGNDSRYDGNVTGIRINANKNITLAGVINNTVNGAQGGTLPGLGGGNAPQGPMVQGGAAPVIGGNTKRKTASFSYSDQISKKTNLNMSYSYSLSDVNSLNNSLSQDFSTNGTTFIANDNNSLSNSNNHNLRMDFRTNLDNANFLQVTPSLSYATTRNNTSSSALFSGLIHQDQTGKNVNFNQTPNFGLTALYSHVFFPTGMKKNRRSLTVQLNASNRNDQQDKEQNSNIIYYKALTDDVLRDSLIHRLVERDNLAQTYRTTLTYSNQVTPNAFFQFSGDLNYNGYNNKAITNNIDLVGSRAVVDSLNNIFAYSFTQARLSFSYRYKKNKSEISLGATALPSMLSGTNTTLGTVVHNSLFNVIPVFRYSYSWTSQRYASVNYTGMVSEPQFYQLQPIRDVSNPQYPVVGNPDLKATLNHVISMAYGLYSPNTRFGITTNINTTFYQNRVVNNIVQIKENYDSYRYETRFININGAYQTAGNYTISKQAANRKYSLSLTGNISHAHYIGMSNNEKNISSQWSFLQKLSPKVNPGKNFEINPSVSYWFQKADNSLPSARDTKTSVLSLQVDGRLYFLKSWNIGYTASKNFVRGISADIANNPLIISPYLEKEFTKRKTIKLRVQAFDLLDQNKFINRTTTETNITDTRSNSLSRYIMFNLSANLQRFKGTPKRNGEALKRKNDGSFIYNK
jgi:hypothetical protein